MRRRSMPNKTTQLRTAPADGSAVCTAEGCERPTEEGTSFPGCAEHRRIYDAQARTEAWDFVLEILGPWVEGVDPIGSEELTRVMRGALEEAEWEFNLAQDELEAAEGAL